MPRRTRLVVAAALAIALLAATAFLVMQARRPTSVAPVSPAEGRAAAVRACSEAIRFEGLVSQNAPIDDVLASLGRAEHDADTAARADPSYLALAGGIKALRIALDANDGRAARTGIDVVRAECRRLPA